MIFSMATDQDRELTPRERQFCAEYVIDHNRAAAAQRAGYNRNPRSAKVQAARLLTRANLRALIAEMEAKAVSSAIMNAQAVIAELSRIARLAEAPYARRVRALEVLAKHHRLLTDRVELEQRTSFEELVLRAEELAAEKQRAVEHAMPSPGAPPILRPARFSPPRPGGTAHDRRPRGRHGFFFPSSPPTCGPSNTGAALDLSAV